MIVKDILKLIDAGFTKEDILRLDAYVTVVPDGSKAESAKKTPEDPKTKTEPAKTDPEPQTPTGVTLSDAQFTKLLQQLNVHGASLDVPPEADLTKTLGEHFTDLLVGK